MSENAHSTSVRRRRLVVALDRAEDAQLLVDAAADMAARMHADLAGLFIEDMDLLGLGDNPLIRMVSAHAAATQSIATREIERALRRQVATAREAFERAAKARRLESSFEVRRGRLASALQDLEEVDLILVRRGAGNARAAAGSRRAGMSAAMRQLILSSPQSMIVLDVRAGTAGRLIAFFDGSAESELALAAAADVADRRGGDGITVLPMAASDEIAAELFAQAQVFLSHLGHRPKAGPRVAPEIGAICQAVRLVGPGLLVLHADHPLLAGDGMAQLLDDVDCSVMVVR